MTIKLLNLHKVTVIVMFLTLFLIVSCIEEFDIAVIEEYGNTLVVDGRITNLPGPYTVKLSTSVSITESEFPPVRRAIVMIIDDVGNSETLTETNEGIYQTAETGIRGVVGRSYKLFIKTIDGKKYESDFEELLAPVEIESLSAQIESRFAPNLYAPDLSIDYEDGYQFYVTTGTSDKIKNYYYWELEETWEIRSTYKIEYIYYPKGRTGHNDNTYIPASSDTLYYCWKTIKDKLFTFSTDHLNSAKITNLPLNFVPIQSEMLNIKYSLLLKQFTISENIHNFINALINQEDGLEGLYTKQPYQIRGNVFNTNNPDEAVLGYFVVASTATNTRLTVPKPPTIRSRWHTNCAITDFLVIKGEQLFNIINQGLGPYLVSKYEYFDEELGILEVYDFLPPVECIDCTSREGVTKKPDYWDQ